eukprot:TRINITY_DN5834_c0_g3_i1.p1 TRINITY_DN5834_c0_g3~~TRINITY_DN5834_c0_g3_i1.p1  ORF type:complete len:523 (+),score=114.96 TRINITY_DN5834_c0_g3_i1:817-2385(+)
MMSLWSFKDYSPVPIIGKDFPNQEILYSSSTYIAFVTGPDEGTSRSQSSRSRNTTQFIAGKSVSTYERNTPDNLIVDCFVAELMHQYSIVGLSDGVRSGAQSRATSFTALSSALDFLRSRLKALKDKRPKVSDMIQIFFSAFKAANKTILDTQGSTADVCLGAVFKLLQDTELSPSWAFVGANIGSNKCYCWSQRTRQVTEITQVMSKGSIGCGDKGPLDIVLAIGPANADTAIVPYFYPCEEGDIIFMFSDGLHSNLDPEVLRSSPSCLGFTTSNWSALAVLSPEEMKQRKQHFLEELISDLIGEAASPREIVDQFMDFVVEVTKEKREFIERFNQLDQKKITRQERLEVREILKKMKGRLGHATCVAVKVGEFTSTKVRTTMMLNPEIWAHGYENQAVGLPFDIGASAAFLGKEGYLGKIGGKLQIWHQRYFVLKEGGIRYFKRPKDKKPKGEITLSPNARVMLLADEFEVADKTGKKKKIKKPDVFLLSVPGRDYYLQASSKEVACEWVEFINHNRALL